MMFIPIKKNEFCTVCWVLICFHISPLSLVRIWVSRSLLAKKNISVQWISTPPMTHQQLFQLLEAFWYCFWCWLLVLVMYPSIPIENRRVQSHFHVPLRHAAGTRAAPWYHPPAVAPSTLLVTVGQQQIAISKQDGWPPSDVCGFINHEITPMN